jgi:MFS family permease
VTAPPSVDVIMQMGDFEKSIRLLGTRRFGTFWFASLLSSIGTWAQQVAQPWLLLSLGASSFVLGLDNFAMGGPVFALTLVGGMLADRADRRHVIALFQSIQMLCPLTIVALLLVGAARPWMIVSLSLVVGITDALSMPSFQTIVPSIVEREQIPAGTALNSTQFNLSRILGPALAGMLMVSVGATGAFAVSAASYLPFILVALWILPRASGATARPGVSAREQTLAGIKAIAGDPALRGALLTVLVTSLFCAPLITFSPVLIRSGFGGTVGHFSLIIGAFGAGGLLGSAGLLAVAPGRDRRPISSWLAAAYALVAVMIAVTHWLWTLPLLFVLAGVAMTASNTSANALLLAAAPTGIRGETISLYSLAMRGGVAVGSVLTGVSVSLLGVREALLINGAAALLLQIAIGRHWRRAPLAGIAARQS